jgi:hypothetical protein
MLDPYDAAVVLDTWSLRAAEGDGDAAGAYVTGFARDNGMDAALLPAARRLVASAFARAMEGIDAASDDEMEVDVATDGECLTVRIASCGAPGRGSEPPAISIMWADDRIAVDRRRGGGIAVTVELPMTSLN